MPKGIRKAALISHVEFTIICPYCGLEQGMWFCWEDLVGDIHECDGCHRKIELCEPEGSIY
jgi:hypothetical protein